MSGSRLEESAQLSLKRCVFVRTMPAREPTMSEPEVTITEDPVRAWRTDLSKADKAVQEQKAIAIAVQKKIDAAKLVGVDPQ